MRRLLVWWAMVMSAGCGDWWKFDRPPAVVDADLGAPDADPVDSAPPDAEAGCLPDQVICDDAMGRYTECSSSGVVTLALDCPLGCATDVEKCLDIDPSNGLAAYVDQARTSGSAPSVTFSGSSTINTTTGVVFNGGTSVDVPTDTYNGMRVLMFDSIVLGGTLKVTGEMPLAIVALGDVTITGLLDVSADGSMQGPGAIAESAACVGVDTGGNFAPAPGAGGGGRYESGARGGTDANGIAGGAGGGASRDDDLVPLLAGCRGGRSIYAGMTSVAGGGGGAIQIISPTLIALSGSGSIDASAGGGQAGAAGGSGGGSGGGILLEAPQVTLDGAGIVISTKGAAGSAAGGVGNGADGGTAAPAATGGVNGVEPGGGAGGTETVAPTVGGSSQNSGDSGGGGGGSVGQLRVNNSAGAINPQGGATIRSRMTAAVLRTRQAP